MLSWRKMFLFILLSSGMIFFISRWWQRKQINSWTLNNYPARITHIICFGDSLVAGVGASSPNYSYPAQLAQTLQIPVYNSGFPGVTAAEAKDRLHAEPGLAAPLVIVTLGGNDIMRSIPLNATIDSLEGIFRELHSRKAFVAFTEVLGLTGRKRHKAYISLCRRNGVVFIPDIMRGVLLNNDLRADQVHPNNQGYKLIADRIKIALEPFITQSTGH